MLNNYANVTLVVVSFDFGCSKLQMLCRAKGIRKDSSPGCDLTCC